jgi:hypothetical protein
MTVRGLVLLCIVTAVIGFTLAPTLRFRLPFEKAPEKPSTIRLPVGYEFGVSS